MQGGFSKHGWVGTNKRKRKDNGEDGEGGGGVQHTGRGEKVREQQE